MKHYFLLIVITTFFACKVTPYSGNDVYNLKAALPADEAPHYKNSLEWWYFTGHLKDKNSDREFGIEYVFFHFNPLNKSDYMMVNIAITDPQNNKFYYDYYIDKLNHLLGFKLPLNLIMLKKDTIWTLSGQEGEYRLQAKMTNNEAGLNLSTKPIKPVLLHNGTGYENYGQYTSAGYYSYPRLETEGQLMVDGESIDVTGELWYDRQWNCIGVYTKDVAWDWFSIQFDEPQEELMIYQLYNVKDDKYIYGGSLYTENNDYKDIPDDMELIPLAYWLSPDSKIKYPVKWQIKVPSWELDVIATAVFEEQELKINFGPFTSFYYWEGMCNVEGTRNGKPVSGNSYIEMTNRGIIK